MSKRPLTNPRTGLSAADVNQRLASGNSNVDQLNPSRSLASIIRGNVVNLFNGVVGACFLLLIALGQWKDSLFGFALVSNLLIGIIQEYSAKRTLDRLAVLNQPLARVRRDSADSEVPRELLVVGDIVLLRSGDQILADGTIVESEGLDVDESLLTGESDPSPKTIGDRVLSGCGIVAGSGVMCVTEVGAETYASTLTAEARRFTLVNSELRNALNRLIRWVTWALIPLVLIVINGQVQTVGGWSGVAVEGWIDVAVRSTSSIVAMIPQGLILITSISFALAAVTLTRKRVLLQELPAVEGLARVDVLCIDKTGTLTDGQVAFDAIHPISGANDFPAAETILGLFASDPAANTTALSLVGRVPESAFSVTTRIPFSSARKWSAVVTGGVTPMTWVLGAPEFVLDVSSPAHGGALSEAARIAERGVRTLALAASTAQPGPAAELPSGLVPVALITFTENVRDDAHQTLEYFREQGVTVFIISGDNPRTVAAIARKAGIEVSEAIDARTLPTDIEALADVLEIHRVFGRATPEQKRTMMAALQSRGHVVAMIGDGVNDALALKHADLGIAMGSGAPATRAVSNLVLLDSRFSSLPGVVDEGRKVIANIERLSRLFLTKTVWAMILAAVFGALFLSFPFMPRQLSAIDFFTIGIPAFLIALLPNSRRYVPGFLGRALMFCIPAGVVTAAAVLWLTWAISTDGTWGIAESQTATALVLSMTGLWVLTSLTRPLDGWRVAIVVAMAVVSVGLFGIPLFAEFFGFVPLTWEQFALVALVGGAANAALALVTAIVDRRNRAALATT
jgi:cation-transporting ATPase E